MEMEKALFLPQFLTSRNNQAISNSRQIPFTLIPPLSSSLSCIKLHTLDTSFLLSKPSTTILAQCQFHKTKINMHASQFCLPILLVFTSFYILPSSGLTKSTAISAVNVGVILDWNHIVGKVSKTSITMALEDFYANHNNYTTRIVVHNRDSKSDVVEAASAAIDLLKNVQVQAILGPQRSTQADFVTDIGNKSRVPIISQATSPSLSSVENQYFVRAAQNAYSQIEALTAIFKAFNWREVVLIYEDSFYGGGMVLYVTDALLKNNVQVKHLSVISISTKENQILQELYKLKTMQSRVFVVNMLPTLASRFFLKVKEADMMTKGYTWIITDGLTSLLDSLDPIVISSMQGVLGVKTYVPESHALEKFNEKWRKRFRQENPDIDKFELNVFGLWAYDSVQALAMAIERAGIAKNQFQIPSNSKNLTDLAAIGTSEMGEMLLQYIRNIRFTGLSGDFHLIDGQLKSSDFQIVNVIGKGERHIGFWTQKYGLSKNLKSSNKYYTTNSEDLGAIVWPGETNEVPRGWDLPTNENKLRVGVPVKSGFSEFVRVDKDPRTNVHRFTGFCIDVFKEAINQPTWSYAVPYDFIPYEKEDGEPVGNYNDLVNQIHLGKFDAVVGDVTILANRSNTVDFSLPFTESGVSMVVPIKGDERRNAWIFMKPLTTDLWLTSGAFFVFTGFVVWVLEHRVNKEFRGPPRKQVGIIFWFSFSTMVFAQKEKITSNLTRFVVIVWMFLVLILTSSYTASLTSMLTVQKLQPTVTDIKDLIRNGEYVGYQDGSFVDELLISKGVDRSKLRNYSSVDDFDEALTKGSKNGGVGAIVDELPYIKLLLTKHCTKYTMVGPTYKTSGLGFAFQKGSPIVTDVSRAILSVMETKMVIIEREWFGEKEADCAEQTGNRITSDSLTLDSFKGLFIIAGVASVSSLFIFVSIFLYENRHVIKSERTISQKLGAIAKNFDQQKPMTVKKEIETNFPAVAVEGDMSVLVSKYDFQQSPAVSIMNQGGEGDEGFFATEPGTPLNEIEFITNNDNVDAVSSSIN